MNDVLTINVAEDFYKRLSGGLREHGNYSGEVFREDILLPMLRELHRQNNDGGNEQIYINFDGVTMCTSTWVREAFEEAVTHRGTLPLSIFYYLHISSNTPSGEFSAGKVRRQFIDKLNQASRTSCMNNLTHIVAISNDNVIGDGNTIPWNSRADMKFFRETTQGAIVVMGRKTYDSIPRKLDGRVIVVITRNKDYVTDKGDLIVVSDNVMGGILEAARLYGDCLTVHDKAFVAGGGEVYQLTKDLVNEAIVSHIDVSVTGDVKYHVPEALTLSRTDEVNLTDSEDPLKAISHYAL